MAHLILVSFIHCSSLSLDHSFTSPDYHLIICSLVLSSLDYPSIGLAYSWIIGPLFQPVFKSFTPIHWFNLFFGPLTIDLSFLGLKFDSHVLALLLASYFALGSSRWPCHHPILVSFHRWFCAFLSHCSRRWAGDHSDRGLFGMLPASHRHATPYVKNSVKTFLVHVEHTSGSNVLHLVNEEGPP